MEETTSVTLSVIVPTIGRRSLRGTLASIAEQALQPGDEILVLCSNDGDFGNRARQSLLERARGTHVVFMDDDDQFAVGAFEAIRAFAREHPGRIGIFRMRQLDGRVRWVDPELRYGNVSTQMFCVPNLPESLGSWVAKVGDDETQRFEKGTYGADFDFITRTIELQDEPVFRAEIVALNRSDRRAWMRTAMRLQRGVAAISRRLRGLRTSDSA